MTHRVEVTIATYRRPKQLRSALRSLAEAASAAPNCLVIGVTLVDDDPLGSAGPLAAEFTDTFGGGCTYVLCGAQNISTARNAGLQSGLGRADWIGSIDDDVTVPKDWFSVCLVAVTDTGFNAVTGPLLKDYRNGAPWLSREPFDQMGRLVGTDGRPAFVCATGNNWMSAAFLRERPDLRFSVDLGRTGGEDMDFFYRAVEAGLRPVYSDAAAVTETEPPARCTLRYQLRRAFWLGISEAQISLRLGLAGRARLLARAARRAGNRGARQLPAEALRRRGVRYSLAVLTQCLGVTLGVMGMEMRHK